ncbi:hypothetical protein DIC82_13540 [Clostridium beijerinckii]|nr:hypothetical protein DIC82_13540 [Clostridium beijerinckii]
MNISAQFKSCHGITQIISKLPKVGIFRVNNGMNARTMNRSAMEDKSKFTSDNWVECITPLINRALAEARRELIRNTYIENLFLICDLTI